ncbi:MAG TPA: class I SAM-dependent methyltransferase [Pirellulales bacterium]|nr:class I SAM-dependent methyltransferase [Pirellulales bacterium]
MSQSTTSLTPPEFRSPRRRRKAFNRLVETKVWERVSYPEYREHVRRVYAGPKGALLWACSLLSLHAPLGDRMFRQRRFDLRGRKSILDVGSGAGQIVQHLLKYADGDAAIVGLDISSEMLRRARGRIKSDRPQFLSADLSRLPFADCAFDCITCGYVLEHLPEAGPGLSEMARVLAPGGRMLLLTTEDSFGGAWTSRLFLCRTYNRQELLHICREVGLEPVQELWLSDIHKALRAGGICWELRRV